MNLDLSKIKKIHFIGIGGVGISALARMMLGEGKEISGTNDIQSPKTLRELESKGVQISLDHTPINLPEADAYVYSDAWLTNAPKLIAQAKDTGKPVLSYFQALGIVAQRYKVIAVAGTHGKSTTTAMVADVLEDAGVNPTSVVGSIRAKTKSNFSKGSGEYMLVEADEYRKHFLNFTPQILVITNIEADHLDYYKNLEEIEETFCKLMQKVPDDGAIILNKKELERHTVVAQCYMKAEKRGVTIVDYMDYVGKVPKLKVPGEHNKKNAACALAVAQVLGVEEGVPEKSLSDFSGTWRRFEFKGQAASGAFVYDDYAHHPTEIIATLAGARGLFQDKKITIIFQPHLFSRTKSLFKEFSESFKDADRIILVPIYKAREEDDGTMSSEKLMEEIEKQGKEAMHFETFEQVISYLNDTLGENDVVITMGAGDVYHIGEQYLQKSE